MSSNTTMFGSVRFHEPFWNIAAGGPPDGVRRMQRSEATPLSDWDRVARRQGP
jgi:hypothetical protein